MNRRLDDILIILWSMVLIFNLVAVMYNPSPFMFILTGFSLGFLLHMALVTPLLNSYRNHIDFLNKMLKNLFAEIDKSNSKRRKRK